MSAELKRQDRGEMIYVRRDTATPVFPELSMVILSAPATAHGGRMVPAGSSGAIVAVWNEGEAYEIEFAEPVGTLATVKAEGLRAA